MKKIVIIGGGTGTSSLVKGLKKYPVDLSVVVSSWDDGGSNGRLRNELGAFPFSDVRQCLAALAEKNNDWVDFFTFRFSSGQLKGHTVANLFLAGLQKITGSVEEPILIATRLLKARGRVFPATLVPTQLSATLIDGRKIIGEHNIDEPKTKNQRKIKNIFLRPNGLANPEALAAIKRADVIVFGPGDLYTSLVPNLLVKGFVGAINNTGARKVLITNIMTKFGQTDGYKASDFIKTFSKFLGAVPDLTLVNNGLPGHEALKMYKRQSAALVAADTENLNKIKTKVILGDFISKQFFLKSRGDVLQRSFLRHDSEKLAKLIFY